MKNHISLVLFLCISAVLSANAQGLTQNQYANAALASMFEEIELDRVPTGYLLDRAVESIDIRKYNGCLTNDNYGNLSTFRNCIQTLNSAKVNALASIYDGDAITNSLSDFVCINIGMALFKYDFISANALTSNLISYQNGKVYDVYSAGIWQNPYASAYVFVSTPGIMGVDGLTVTYTFDSDNILTNASISSMQFDAGDGNGYRSITSDSDCLIYYGTDGEKELK